MPPVPEQIRRTIDTLYRSESGRVLATLVRLLGDLDLAEEAMHEAFAAALESWPQTGIPDKPRPWLISTARFKAIDVMRRRARFGGAQRDLAAYIEARIKEAPLDEEEIEDDRLRLIFTCCHPALPPEGQVALTLREICGLTTEEIARAFLITPATLAQRIVRVKAVIRAKAIPYQVPVSEELSGRLGAVLLVVYLIFNEGYSAETTGAELSREAIRLGRLLLELLPEPEVMGLLGLMLLQESRRAARTSAEGDLILLEQQDRSLWNKEQIAEGISLTESALRSGRFGAYTLQAAIAAVHAESSSVASTAWREEGRARVIVNQCGWLLSTRAASLWKAAKFPTSRSFELASAWSVVIDPLISLSTAVSNARVRSSAPRWNVCRWSRVKRTTIHTEKMTRGIIVAKTRRIR